MADRESSDWLSADHMIAPLVRDELTRDVASRVGDSAVQTRGCVLASDASSEEDDDPARDARRLRACGGTVPASRS